MDKLALQGMTIQKGNPGLAAGTTTTYSIATAFYYDIQGKSYTKGTATNAATPTTDVNTSAAFTALSASEGCCFVWCVNSSGTVQIAQGPIRSLSGEADGANASFSAGLPDFPSIPDTSCPFGYLIVKAGASASNWTMGSSNLSSVSNVSFSFVSVGTLPPRPQAS